MNIKFDKNNRPSELTVVLSKKNGDLIGEINAEAFKIKRSLNEADEIYFEVYKNKSDSTTQTPYWDEITDFKCVWCRELNSYFEIYVDTSDDNAIRKTVTGKGLGEAELSQVNLYDTEYNTENDINRDGYIPIKIFNPETKKASLLDLILDKVPHYSIGEVSTSLRNLQRTFSFDEKSIYDALQEIATEIQALLKIDVYLDANGRIQRKINLYDLLDYCGTCNKRFETFKEVPNICPDCGKSTIIKGYGEAMNILVEADELASSIEVSPNSDTVKNCFKLSAGDDDLTAAIKNINPNGSDYIWYIPDYMKREMSNELQKILNNYDSIYEAWVNGTNKIDYCAGDNVLEGLNDERGVVSGTLSQYNKLVDKYNVYITEYNNYRKKNSLSIIDEFYKIKPSTKDTFNGLINKLYNIIDLKYFVDNELMPNVETTKPSLENQVEIVKSLNGSKISVNSVSNLSVATAKSSITSYIKIYTDSRYKFTVETQSTELKNTTTNERSLLNVTISVSNYSDSDNTIQKVENLTFVFIANNEKLVQQQCDYALNRDNKNDFSITGIIGKDVELSVVEENVKNYSVQRLKSFADAIQSCLDICLQQINSSDELNKHMIQDESTGYFSFTGDADTNNSDIIKNVYIPYLNKHIAIESELKSKEKDLNCIYAVRDYLAKIKSEVNEILNFEKFIKSSNEDLWTEFCLFRREDKYSNDNYISDGLNNSEVLSRATEFVNKAYDEIYKSAELQIQITSTLNNLLAIKELYSITEHFDVGNWIIVKVDGEIYKVRLVDFEVDYSNLSTISVTFSDVIRTRNGVSDVKSVLEKAGSMASSYEGVKRQATQGSEANSVYKDWVLKGIDATNVMIKAGSENQDIVIDNHGLLARKYNSYIDDFEPCQMKIINSSLALTTDNWQTLKTAVGKFRYKDPDDNMREKDGYGVIAEKIIGKQVLGEELSFYNLSGNLKFDDNGLVVSNNNNSLIINPSADSIFTITNKNKENVIYFDSDGNGTFEGTIKATAGLIAGWKIEEGRMYDESARQYFPNASAIVGINKYGNGDAFYAGASDVTGGDSAKFRVTHEGKLFATDANITGTVNATNGSFTGTINASLGTIGGWIIDSQQMYRDMYVRIKDDVDSTVGGALLYRAAIQAWNGDSDGDTLHASNARNVFYVYQNKYNETTKGWDFDTYMFYVNSRGEMFVRTTLVEGTLTIAGNCNITGHMYINDILFDKRVTNEWQDTAYDTNTRNVMYTNGALVLSSFDWNNSKWYNTYISSGTCYINTWVGAVHINAKGAGLLVNGKSVSGGSSREYKENIKELSNDRIAENLYSIPIWEFDFKNEYKEYDMVECTQAGFIADEVGKYYPSACIRNKDGIPVNWSVRNIVPPMLKLIQNHKNDIDALKEAVEILNKKINELETAE